MFRKCLIANRGEIALRILSTCQTLGIRTVVAHSLCDQDSLAVSLADEAVCIGPDPVALSYMNIDHICEAAMLTHCDAVALGYGFLSESAKFAKMAKKCGLTVIGINPDLLETIEHKHSLKEIISSLNIPVISGTSVIHSLDEAIFSAQQLGYPVMIKPTVGGGGRGIRIFNDVQQLTAFLQSFRDIRSASMMLEKFSPSSRHIEIQILADQHQNIVSLSSRNCTVQYNYQKVIEEAPFSSISVGLHQKVLTYAMRIARHLALDNIATVEFLIDPQDEVYFMEINPRIQVEHPVSEMICGIDIIEQQFRAAAGQPLSVSQSDIRCDGFAIECRINAQDPQRDFAPVSGNITRLFLPNIQHVRIDTALFAGCTIPIHYDSLLAKVIVWGETRAQALMRMSLALEQIQIEGIPTNLRFMQNLLRFPGFVHGGYTSELFPLVVESLKNQKENQQSDSFVCPCCNQSLSIVQMYENFHTCPHCHHHFRISAVQRIAYLIDTDTFTELDAQIVSRQFTDFPGYREKLRLTQQQTGLREAVICGIGKICGETVCIGVLDASFLMGSMGHIVGDKIARLIETAMSMDCALIIVSASGGARMQEGIISLMQMAKTASALQRLDAAGGLFISILTDPTTGGVTASFAMLGDILISEPDAVIGFAGRRVIEKTIKETLPAEFQRAEYVLDHGCLDMIVDRRQLKQVVGDCLKLHRRTVYE